jgi:hypothetical protein
MRTRFRGPSWPSFLLGVSVTVIAVLAWFGLGAPPPAYGQLPDSGAQRADLIREAHTTNVKLDEIAGLLREIRDDARAANPAKNKPASAPKQP